jgi:hypothetical protein
MKVKYLIDQLKKYNPDDEIIAAYWDKEWFSELLECDITDDQWLDIADAGNDVIETMDTGDYLQLAAVEILHKETTNDNA